MTFNAEKYFDRYVSNTLAGIGNQSFFDSCGEKTCYVFYKTFKAGIFGYSFLFSNVIDSTYADGAHSVANIECSEWKILELSAFVIDSLRKPKKESCFKKVTFGGKNEKNVKKGELFYSDEIVLDIPENYYRQMI